MGTMDRFRELELAEGTLAVHWFEQSGFAVRAPGGPELLVDPYFPTERPPERFLRSTPPVDPSTLGPDLVLLTHEHGDHTHPPTIAAIAAASPNTRFVGPRESIERIVAESGVAGDNTYIVTAGDRLAETGVVVHAVYAKPPDGDPSAAIAPPKITHLGFVVEIGGRRLYFTGDPINTIARLSSLVEPIAQLNPEIGFMTTHPTEGEFPFFSGVRELAERTGLRTVIPSHYGCFSARDYDPALFARSFDGSGIDVIVIPWNSAVVIDG